MSNWIEHFNKAVDLIPYRKAGGMYTKIAEEAYRAGFEAGGEDAMTLKPEPPGVGKIFNNDLIEIRELEEKQKQDLRQWDSLSPKEAKVDKTKT